jgi:hypothetical protein
VEVAEVATDEEPAGVEKAGSTAERAGKAWAGLDSTPGLADRSDHCEPARQSDLLGLSLTGS